MSIDVSALPVTWPDAASIREAAQKIRGLGNSLVEDTDTIDSTWQGLKDHYSSPGDQQVFEAIDSRMKPVARVARGAMRSIASTLDDFADTMAQNKERYTAVLAEAGSYQAPETEPVGGVDPKKARIEREIRAVANLYDTATKETAAAVQKPDIAGFKVPKDAQTVADYYTAFVKWTGQVNGLSGQFSWKNGKLVFSYSKDLNPFRAKHPKAFGVTTKAMQKLNVTPGLLKRLTGTDTKRISAGSTRRLYRNTPLYRLLQKHPYLRKTFNNFNLKVENGVVKFQVPIRRLPGPPGAKGRPHGQTDLTKRLNKLAKNPLMKFAGPLGTGLDAYDNYTDAYNDALARDPYADPAEVVATAATDAAIKTTASTVGAYGGTVAGAALASFIPIPGATIVGGYLGGLAGEWLGGQAGDLINALRHGELGKEIDEKVEAVKDTAKKVGSFLNPFD